MTLLCKYFLLDLKNLLHLCVASTIWWTHDLRFHSPVSLWGFFDAFFFSIHASLYLCILYFRYWDLFRKWWMSDISTLKTFHFHMALEHTCTQHTGTCSHACLTPNMRISTKEKTAWNYIEKNYRDWTSYTQCWQKRIFWKPAVCNCLPLFIY